MKTIRIVGYNSKADKYLVKKAVEALETSVKLVWSQEFFEIEGVWVRSAERTDNPDVRKVSGQLLTPVTQKDANIGYLETW